MPKVSVIMPSLNVEKYIRECMESVMNQTLSDIEIIAVDAGSTDGTLEILEEYAKLDKRIQVIRSEKKSYGYQVNYGIALAQGEYISIVETDDVIVPNMYEILYEVCIRNNADFAKGYTKPFCVVDEEDRIFSTSNTFFIHEGIANQVINPSERPDIFLKDRFLWLGLYKNDFIKNIKLNETAGAAFQDVGFMFQTLSQANRAIYIDKPIHFYRQDNGNSSIHNIKSVGYIVNEYNLNRRYLDGKNIAWHTVFYTRMFDQLNSRFDVMARGGCFWSEAVSDIDIIRAQLREAVEAGYLSENILDAERWRKLQLLFADAEGIYKEYQKKYIDIKAEFKSLLEKIGDNQVVIFGAGKHGVFLHKLLKKKQKEVVAFCDNNVELYNTKRKNISVLSVGNAARKYNNATFVVASVKNLEVMKEQLILLGIKEEKIGEYCLGESTLLLGI